MQCTKFMQELDKEIESLNARLELQRQVFDSTDSNNTTGNMAASFNITILVAQIDLLKRFKLKLLKGG